MKTDPKLLFYGAVALAVLYVTYRATKGVSDAVGAVGEAFTTVADKAGQAVGYVGDVIDGDASLPDWYAYTTPVGLALKGNQWVTQRVNDWIDGGKSPPSQFTDAQMSRIAPSRYFDPATASFAQLSSTNPIDMTNL